MDGYPTLWEYTVYYRSASGRIAWVNITTHGGFSEAVKYLTPFVLDNFISYSRTPRT